MAKIFLALLRPYYHFDLISLQQENPWQNSQVVLTIKSSADVLYVQLLWQLLWISTVWLKVEADFQNL